MVKKEESYCCLEYHVEEYWGGDDVVHVCNTARFYGGTRHTKYETFIGAVVSNKDSCKFKIISQFGEFSTYQIIHWHLSYT
jgi:hypothetical protein